MRINQHYLFYYRGIANIIVLGVIPLSSSVYLNWKLHKAVHSPPTLLEEDEKRLQRDDQELAQVLIGIVVIFIVCNTFRVIIEIDNMIGSKTVEECHKAGKPQFSLWSIIVGPLSEFMMVLNSSINMIIYCCLNENFRKHVIPGIKRSYNSFSVRDPSRGTVSTKATVCTNIPLVDLTAMKPPAIINNN